MRAIPRTIQPSQNLRIQRSCPNGPPIVVLLPSVSHHSGVPAVHRLPQPEPRPRLPVRVVSRPAWLVRAVQLVELDGRGRVHRSARRALTAMLHLYCRTGGSPIREFGVGVLSLRQKEPAPSPTLPESPPKRKKPGVFPLSCACGDRFQHKNSRILLNCDKEEPQHPGFHKH